MQPTNYSQFKLIQKDIFYILFCLLVGCAYFYFDIMDSVKPLYIVVPLLIISLASYYIISSKSKINYLVVAIFVVQLIADIIILKGITNTFFLSVSMYFVFNVLLIFWLLSKIGIINLKDILIVFTPITATFLLVIFTLFNKAGSVRLLFVVFAIVTSLLFSLAYYYHSKTLKSSSFWLLMSVSSYIVCYIFSALYHVVKESLIYDSINTLTYLFSIYSFTYAMIMHSKDKKQEVVDCKKSD